MRTNAIPTLLGNLQTKDSALKRTLAALGLRYTSAEICHMRAERGFKALEADASNAVPALIEIYDRPVLPPLAGQRQTHLWRLALLPSRRFLP
jgi:hypothetical protein